jgi:hypothetical protein
MGGLYHAGHTPFAEPAGYDDAGQPFQLLRRVFGGDAFGRQPAYVHMHILCDAGMVQGLHHA